MSIKGLFQRLVEFLQGVDAHQISPVSVKRPIRRLPADSVEISDVWAPEVDINSLSAPKIPLKLVHTYCRSTT